MTQRRPDIHIEDGEWVTIDWKGQREKCCQCGATHRVDYQVIDGKLQFRATRVGR